MFTQCGRHVRGLLCLLMLVVVRSSQHKSSLTRRYPVRGRLHIDVCRSCNAYSCIALKSYSHSSDDSHEPFNVCRSPALQP